MSTSLAMISKKTCTDGLTGNLTGTSLVSGKSTPKNVRKQFRKARRKPNSFNRRSKNKPPNGKVARKTYSLHKILQEKTSPKKCSVAHVIIVRFTLLTQ